MIWIVCIGLLVIICQLGVAVNRLKFIADRSATTSNVLVECAYDLKRDVDAIRGGR
jgi:hypothetical protein